MSNTIKIRRGSGVPTASDFAAYELAYDYTGNDLYVKVGTNMVKVNSEGSGTVTNVIAGNGLAGGGTVTATLDLDFSQLTDMTSDISGTTEFILQNGTTESRKAASEIKLTAFDATGFSIAGTVDTSGSPSASEYARFTDSNTVQGISAAAVRTDLGLVIGTNVQAQNDYLQDIADLSTDNATQNGYVLAYNDAYPRFELVEQSGGVSFNGSTANGLLTYGNSTTADVETNLTFDGNHLDIANGHLVLPYGEINDAGTDLNIVGTNAVTLQSSAGTALTIPNASTNVDINGSLTTEGPDGGAFIGNWAASSSFAVFGTANMAGGEYALLTNGTNTFLGSGNGGATYFRGPGNDSTPELVNNGTNIYMQNAGNFGIGVTNPSEKLQVLGNLKIGDAGNITTFTMSGNYPVVYFDDVDTGAYIANNVNGLFIGKTNSPSSSNDILKFDLTYSKLVTAGGYFEIGGGSSITGILGFNRNISTGAIHNGSYGAYQMQNEGGTFRIQVYNSSGGSVDANSFVIKDTARVGIGTASPGEKLDVKSQINVTNSNGVSLVGLKATEFGYSGSWRAIQIGNTSGNETVSIGYDPSTNSSGSFTGDGREVLFRNGAEFMTPNSANNGFHNDILVLKDGKVGVGIASPAEKLHIVGNVRVHDGGYLAAGDANDIFIRHDGNGHLQSNTGNMFINNVATTNILISVGNDEKVRIENDGDLHVKADVVAYSSTPSDIRLKKNFTKIDNGLDVISKLDGQTFNWKKDEGRLSAGFKAQEVEKVLPHLVDERELPLHSDDEKDYKVLRYEEIIPYLVEAIKEQQQQIEELKNG